jgi:hypothetical protein
MSLRTKCTHCDREAVLVDEALGKNVRCKGCGKPFVARPLPLAAAVGKNGSDPEMRAALKAGQPTAVKTRVRPPSHADDSDDDADDGHPQRRVARKPQADMTLWIGLSAIGLVTIVASVLTFVLIANRQAAVAHVPPQIAKAPAVVEQPFVRPPKAEPPAKVDAPPKVDPKVEAKIEPAPKEDPQPKADPPVEPPMPPPMPNFGEAPANLYGTQGNAQIAPALAAPYTMPRARADDTFYRLGNPRVGPFGDNPRGAFTVQFQVAQRGKLAATHLVIRFTDKHIDRVAVGPSINREKGVLRVNIDPKNTNQFPEDAEVYLMREDPTFGNPPGRFLVSDVIRMGNFTLEETRPRDWTPQEIVRFTKEAPPGLRENAFPDFGVDTQFAGSSGGPIPHRFVDPKGYLLGLEFRVGSWQGEQCLGALHPVYSLDQNQLHPGRITAKEGYAVSGAEVQVRNNVDAIKLHFRRIKPDGSLDPADSYESPWFGATDPTARIVTLGDTGARVLGFSSRAGAVIDGFALVLERR